MRRKRKHYPRRLYDRFCRTQYRRDSSWWYTQTALSQRQLGNKITYKKPRICLGFCLSSTCSTPLDRIYLSFEYRNDISRCTLCMACFKTRNKFQSSYHRFKLIFNQFTAPKISCWNLYRFIFPFSTILFLLFHLFEYLFNRHQYSKIQFISIHAASWSENSIQYIYWEDESTYLNYTTWI